MIDNVFSTIKNELNTYLKSLPGLDGGNQPVVAEDLILKLDGQQANKQVPVIMTLVNLEEERVTKSQVPYIKTDENRIRYIEPEIVLNLYVLIAAFDNNYSTALAHLSGVVHFFQNKSVFTQDSSPGLDDRIEKIIVDLYTLDFERQNHLWGALGAKYQPSVIYRLRLLPIQVDEPGPDLPPILTVNTEKSQI